jgi:SAM-dependent methyltransferase
MKGKVFSMSIFSRIAEEIRYWTQSSWSFEDVGSHWDSTHEYDEINRETYSYFRRFVDGFRLSTLKPNGTVLDFASRTGLGTTYFYQKGKVERVVCMDVSERMGQICAERVLEAGLTKFLWIPIKDYVFPISANVFDSVLCFETVEHFDEPELLLMELGRVIKRGGILILTTPNVLWEPIHALAAILKLHHSEGPHRFIPLPKIKNLIGKAGFKIEALETTVLIPAGPKVITRMGEWIEKRTRGWLMPFFGLRRVVIARKI